MPYQQIGPAKDASRDAVINLEVEGTTATIGVYVTRPRRVHVALLLDGAPVYQKELALSPEAALLDEAPIPAGTRPQALTLRVLDGTEELLSFTPLPAAQTGKLALTQ